MEKLELQFQMDNVYFLIFKKKWNQGINYFIFILRFSLLLTWLAFGLLWLFFLSYFFKKNLLPITIRIFAKIVIFICGVKVNVFNEKINKSSVVYISNHISWLDIFVIQSQTPVFFVAKSDIKEWPILGWLVEKSGNIFIHRKKRNSIKNVISIIKNKLDFGESVVFFPEGTTSVGNTLKPFYPSLFSVFFERKNTKLCPLIINYKKEESKTYIPAYVDNVSLITSVYNILSTQGLEVDLIFLTVKNYQHELKNGFFKKRHELANQVRLEMLDYF